MRWLVICLRRDKEQEEDEATNFTAINYLLLVFLLFPRLGAVFIKQETAKSPKAA